MIIRSTEKHSTLTKLGYPQDKEEPDSAFHSKIKILLFIIHSVLLQSSPLYNYLFIQGHKRIPMVSTYFKQLGFYAGTAVIGFGSWLGWSLVMSGKTGSELTSVVESNDCLYTPFWRSK